MLRAFLRILACSSAFLLLAIARAQVPASAFVNFEARQTNPIRLSPDGRWLFAVNSADARLSVFNITQTPPLLSNEIAVGIEPVSVHARTNDEAWVVNELSDSVSVVSVSRGIVVDTIYVKDEPSDVVFAGGLAFVSVAGSNEVRAFNATTHALTATIPLVGQRPRALAVSDDGSKVYVAFAESGNRTTIIPPAMAPPQSAPTNPNLPAPPQVGLIVDAADPQWNPSVIKYTMPDNDVAEIDTATLTVSRYFPHLGTSNLGLAVQPGTGDLFVTNTDARNLVHFEPNLRAHSVDNRVSRIAIANGALTISDLNPAVDYALLPNPAAQATALAQPTAIAFDPSGAFAYVAAFGSDRIAKLNANGTVASRIELAGGGVDPRNKRGPRGLALNASSGKLYVLNRIANTISVIDTATQNVTAEVPVGAFDPTPVAIRNGRGFLYDARLSGNGTVSCASCHLDGNTDRLAWDLGDPGAAVQAVTAVISVLNISGTFQMHPMKGPMTTQTLKGLKNTDPLHWRGDRGGFDAFNPAFASLLGGSELSQEDIEAFRGFVETLALSPNPNQKLDRTLPAILADGDPVAGRNTFINEQYTQGLTCNSCHSVGNFGSGTNKTITPAALLQESEDFKVPHLRSIYQKTHFNNAPGAVSLDGFGFVHDGDEPTLFSFLSRPLFTKIRNDSVRKTNLSAFILCFDTGAAPAVGYTRTVSATNLNDATTVADWSLLQSQAAAGNIDLIAKGTIGGKRHGLFYDVASASYRSDKTGLGPFSQAQLQAKVASGDTLNLIGVSPGSGQRMGVDRDLNGELDGDGPPFAAYAEWRAYWFTAAEVADSAISGPAADNDADGLPNLLEYALNLDPKTPAITDAPAAGHSGTTTTALTYRRLVEAADIDYAIYESSDLKTWTAAVPANEILTDDGRLQTVKASVATNAAQRKFLQLRVTPH